MRFLKKVIARDYKGKNITSSLGNGALFVSAIKSIDVNKNIKSYKVIIDEHRKSAASGVARGLVGEHFSTRLSC